MSNIPFSGELDNRSWFGKVSAGLVAGFTASVAVTSSYSLLAGTRDTFFNAHGQIAMWAIAPLWTGVLAGCFLFRSGRRAWGWLAGANLVLWAIYAALRLSQG